MSDEIQRLAATIPTKETDVEAKMSACDEQVGRVVESLIEALAEWIPRTAREEVSQSAKTAPVAAENIASLKAALAKFVADDMPTIVRKEFRQPSLWLHDPTFRSRNGNSRRNSFFEFELSGRSKSMPTALSDALDRTLRNFGRVLAQHGFSSSRRAYSSREYPGYFECTVALQEALSAYVEVARPAVAAADELNAAKQELAALRAANAWDVA